MKTIRKSGEDYLEAIFCLSENNKQVRSIDIANLLKVSKPSTFKALQVLAEQGYITKENYGNVILTEKGKKQGAAVLKKHEAMRTLLVDVLKVSPENAEADACKMEHCLSAETTEKLCEFLKTRSKN